MDRNPLAKTSVPRKQGVLLASQSLKLLVDFTARLTPGAGLKFTVDRTPPPS
jgi:hypothetical protein